MLETPEVQIQNPEDSINQQDDLPPQADPAILEPTMDTDVNPAASHDPPSPKPTSPAKSADKSPAAIDDITITGSAFKTPEASRVLTKHSTKEEETLLEKGKTKLELEGYSNFKCK